MSLLTIDRKFTYGEPECSQWVVTDYLNERRREFRDQVGRGMGAFT